MLRKPGDEMLSFARWRQLRNDSNLRGRDKEWDSLLLEANRGCPSEALIGRVETAIAALGPSSA